MAPPTKLTRDLIAGVEYYINNYEALGDHFPMVEGLSCHVKVSRDQLYAWGAGEWPKGHEEIGAEFAELFENMNARQGRVILNGSMDNTFNSAISKLILHKHGYSEKTQTELTGANGGDLVVQLVRFGSDGSNSAT